PPRRGGERRRGPFPRSHMRELRLAELHAPAADRAHQVVVRAVGDDGHEVKAHRLLRPDMVQDDLVVAVRADDLHGLAQVLLLAGPEAENHHHQPIKAPARARRFTHRPVIVPTRTVTPLGPSPAPAPPRPGRRRRAPGPRPPAPGRSPAPPARTRAARRQGARPAGDPRRTISLPISHRTNSARAGMRAQENCRRLMSTVPSSRWKTSIW